MINSRLLVDKKFHWKRRKMIEKVELRGEPQRNNLFLDSFEATFVPHPPRSMHRQFFESVAISCSSSQYNIIRLKRNWFSNKLATHKRVQALILLEKMKRAMKYDRKICQPQNINDGCSVTGSYSKWRNVRNERNALCEKYKFQKMLIHC